MAASGAGRPRSRWRRARGGESGRAKRITPAAARMARDAKTMSARRMRAGIRGKGRRPIPRPPHSPARAPRRLTPPAEGGRATSPAPLRRAAPGIHGPRTCEHGGRGTDRLAVHVAFRLVGHHPRVHAHPGRRRRAARCATRWSARCGSRATRSQLAADGREAIRAGRRARRRGPARRLMPRARRAGGLPAPARRRRPHAGADADRARRGRRPRRRAWRRAPTTTSPSRSPSTSCSRALRALLRRSGWRGRAASRCASTTSSSIRAPTRSAAASG